MQYRSTGSPAATPAATPETDNGAARGARRGPQETMRLPPVPEPGGWQPSRATRQERQAEQTELADDLAGMAETLREVDPRAAERLGHLANAVATEQGRQRWADVDLRRAFHTDRLAHAYALRREGGYASAAVAYADRVRNVLVLVPIFLTWFALAEASKAYATYIEREPDEVSKPFLLLWQRGFGGEASILAPSFSTVAIIDALIIALIIALTFYAHGRREGRDELIDQTADAFQSDLDNILSEASVVLAGDRGSRPALLVRGVERLAERFDQSTQELLTRLRVEHDRLDQIASRREREFNDFGVFASGMRAGAEETHRLLVDLRQVSTGLRNALEDLTSEVSVTSDQQQTLLSAVQSLERLTTSNIQSDQSVTRQMATAASAIADAADKATSGADAAAQAARVATDAVRGIGELTRTLAESQSRVEAAIADEAEANSRLAGSLHDGTDGVAASTRTLQEIGVGLSRLRDELERLANQGAGQTGTLNDLLEEQASVATGLSQVARDLSSVSIVTAQRQQEVNQEVADLVERIHGLTDALGQAARNMPTVDALQQAFAGALRGELAGQVDAIADALDTRQGGDQFSSAGRRDPARLWPRGRE